MTDKTIGALTALGAQVTADTLIEIELAGVSYKVPVIQVRAGAPVTPPVLANFATTSEDTASSSALVATSAAWGFNLTKINNATGNTNQWGSRLKSVPGGAAWTVTSLIERHFLLENFKGGGLILRESATSKFLNIGFTNDGGTLCVGKWNSNTSFAANLATVNEYTRLLWVRAALASSNYVFSFSNDGLNWERLANINLTGFFTTAADQVGFGVHPNNASNDLTQASMDCLSYLET